jgi:hypothetical protein
MAPPPRDCPAGVHKLFLDDITLLLTYSQYLPGDRLLRDGFLTLFTRNAAATAVYARSRDSIAHIPYIIASRLYASFT